MGKRKSSSKPQGPKKRAVLATTFTCLFCNHEKSVSVKVDKKAGVGSLSCSVCAQSFQCGANYLSAPIDIYSEWVDAADAVAKEEAGSAPRGSQAAASRSRQAERLDDDEDDRRYSGEGIVEDDEEY
ncbi:hypothetical protein BJ166DRAFT_496452 [Pestalotiopsis sp. NC0098]|nr:hypothetical protein BJ166DRAFT_496452 [Pestalotiopsis sp. NC0098]